MLDEWIKETGNTNIEIDYLLRFIKFGELEIVWIELTNKLGEKLNYALTYL